MKRYAAVFGVALLASVASMAHAQSVAVPSWGPIPFEAFDRDGSGTVSEQEFYTVRGERMAARVAEGRMMRRAAEAPAYSDIDLDGDNAVSADEFAEHQATHCNRRRR